MLLTAPRLHLSCTTVPVGWCGTLLVLLVEVVDVLVGYNVDVSPKRVFSTDGSDFYGYRVRQITSTHGERILVGDPQLGSLHSCDVIRGRCDIITLPDQNKDNHMGLTLEAEPKTGKIIICGLDTHECDHIHYINGVCYTMNSSLTPSPKLLPGYQECQKARVDLCILFDGSGSIGKPELKSMQHFMRDAVRELKNTTVHLAIVQFSSTGRTELDFNQYQALDIPRLYDKINKLTVMDRLTKTFNGINHTLHEIFTEKAGNRPQATKVLLILTDGEATDNMGDIIQQADEMGVKRFLIGVGNNFNSKDATKMMKILPSEPIESHTLILENFEELENLFTKLQKKILNIEGVRTCAAASKGSCNDSAQTTSFSRELSSAGFSAALIQERIFLGDPGIFDWSGGILDISGTERLINISLQEEDKYGYLGYSIKVLQTPEGVIYVAGAPRHRYVGLVSVFRETPDGIERIQNIPGEQVGSYFGSEIEVCDNDQDGLSDVVLIAAPHFYDARWSGQVSVYRYIQGAQGPLQLAVTLHGESGYLHSQFGAALSALGDLDGDDIGDVAVGAPYEMEGRGALYIFRGEAGGVNAAYCQRLTAPAGGSGFGLSVHGVLDMTQDGLTDVAVGAAGSVALYRTQPLLAINVTVTSSPPEIPIPTVESASCGINVTLNICVDPKILTSRYQGPLNVSLQYAVILDSGRSMDRMSFVSGQREMEESVVLRGAERTCWSHIIHLLDCFLEDDSPVLVSLVASQIPNVSHWLLCPSSGLAHLIQIPFQLCGSGGSCEPDFHLHLTKENLVVEEGGSFSVFLKLQNKGENAKKVTLLATYPPGLSFRKVNITEASRRISILCKDLETQSLLCNISHPIMRRASWANIHIMFGIISNVSWPDQVQLSVHVTSENDGNGTNMKNKVMEDVPVLSPMNIIARRLENTTKHLQFIEPKKQSNVSHSYQIQNLWVGPAHTEFSVTVTTPPVEMDDLVWDHHVTSRVNRGNCTQDLSHTSQRAGTVPGNKTFICTLEQHGTINISVTGNLKPKHAWKVTTSVNLSTAVTIQYNQMRYHSQLGGKFHHVQIMTIVDLVVLPDHVPYIVGGTGGGVILLLIICVLLYKCGFFKRYKDRMEEDSPFTDAQQPMTSDDDAETEGATEGATEPRASPEPADLTLKDDAE